MKGCGHSEALESGAGDPLAETVNGFEAKVRWLFPRPRP